MRDGGAMQLFISYSREDLAFAEQLVEDLLDYDVRVWIDVRSIPHGANWDIEVQKGLDSSDLMLVLLSPASTASQNVADEWSYFIEKDKPILPLLIKPTDVPFRLSRRQRVDFTKDYRAGFLELIRAIGSPRLIDPDSTQRIRPPLPGPARAQPGGVQRDPPATLRSAAPSGPTGRPIAGDDSPRTPPRTGPAAAPAPEVGVRMLPVIWAESYSWFDGMKNGTPGDALINDRELALIPRAAPIVAIPLSSLISAKLQRSVDQYLKLTYYGPGGVFKSLVLMGAARDRRAQINREILNLLKLLTGRSLD
ncbi:MAG: TIR domain-containing protein [Anaerolineae bacterium]|nr:TIR domain-containing protein [Anaerolineae bacterium]